jgi:hypothetical protein
VFPQIIWRLPLASSLPIKAREVGYRSFNLTARVTLVLPAGGVVVVRGTQRGLGSTIRNTITSALAGAMRCALFVIGLALCAVSVSTGQPRSRTVLNYSFEPVVKDGKPALHIVLEFKGGPMETANLEVPTAWGDATHLERGIANLTATHRNGRVRVSYDLVKDWVVPPLRPDHHAILEPECFEFNTQNGIVHPRLGSAAPVRVSFDWRKLPTRWSLATSFGTGTRRQSFRGSWGEVNDALFAGGDFRIYRRRIAGRPLILAIRSNWPLTDKELASRIQKMISLERAFWHDYDFPYCLHLRSGGRRRGWQRLHQRFRAVSSTQIVVWHRQPIFAGS